jgi:kanamycin kinase
VRSDVGTPAAVRALAGGEAVRPVWVNELGGITFEIGTAGRRRFVKWAPAGSGLDLAAEAARLAWAVAFTPVPHLLGQGADGAGSWLVTSALAGEMAVTARWKADPRTAVAAIGAGLRAMHEALPVHGCPFSWSAAGRIADARRRPARGLLDPARWHPSHQALSVAAALDRLADAPPADKLVVCHGDSCAPNTLLTGDGRCSGHVDLGELGVADRWADLAVATWSTTWNYGPGWEIPLLDAYGIAPDPDRTRYYRLLWELGP